MNSTIKKQIEVMNPLGLHARPASIFVKIANKYESDINVMKDTEVVNGKSMMGLLTLAVEKGTAIELEITGRDAEQAMEELESFLTSAEEPSKPEGRA